MAVQISKLFAYQSYHDTTLLQQALLAQPVNQRIVPSTIDEPQGIGGWGVGLHPSSQTPVAVELRYSGKGAGQTVILVPGQVYFPKEHFSGVRWGLPFGWLGGGMATLVLFDSKEANVRWSLQNEVIFHRLTIPILQPAAITAAGAYNNAPKNWPLRFPWTQALQGANAIPQPGAAQIAIAEPTRTLLVLRGVTSLAAPADMRMSWQATNDVGLDSAGAPVLTNPIFDTLTWPQWTSSGTSGNMATDNPGQMYTGMLARLAADDGGVIFKDTNVGGPLNGLFVDVVRYGRL